MIDKHISRYIAISRNFITSFTYKLFVYFFFRSKEKITKENSTMKVRISELLAQIEILSEEKTSIRKVVEKLEINIHESSYFDDSSASDDG